MRPAGQLPAVPSSALIVAMMAPPSVTDANELMKRV
jgi:hypothetical protein